MSELNDSEVQIFYPSRKSLLSTFLKQKTVWLHNTQACSIISE